MTASIPPPMKHGELPDPLAHRYLLGQPLDYQPFAGSDLFARLGGQATVDRLVDLLYDGFQADPALRLPFPRDLTGGRHCQKMFFAQWLGGSHRYAERSYSGLVHRHESVPITRSVVGRWLQHFQQALTRTVAGETDRRAILEQASALAWALVNEEDTPTAHQSGANARGGPPRRRTVASCGVAARALSGAARLAQRGDTTGLEAALDQAPVLLAHGADPTTIGVGRWVLHPKLAPLLASRGASVGSSGAWIGACCTGNQGRKDDPDYVRALLRHGARASDRRTGGHERATGVEALAATGLHYAAKAGFARTVEILLQHGADPTARDTRGRTPLDWLEECAPSPAREQVRRLLTARAPGQRTPG